MSAPESGSIPRTAVPAGIADPVASARAELKAALAAIEQKGNLPRRVQKASERGAARLRVAVRRQPVVVIAGVVVAAAAVGGAVWAITRTLSR